MKNVNHFFDKGLVSIIMLSHGDSTYVVETVKSVLAQTYQNWELLFVAKSNDETLDAFSELREEDIKKQIEAGKEWPSDKYGRSRIRTSGLLFLMLETFGNRRNWKGRSVLWRSMAMRSPIRNMVLLTRILMIAGL